MAPAPLAVAQPIQAIVPVAEAAVVAPEVVQAVPVANPEAPPEAPALSDYEEGPSQPSLMKQDTVSG